MEINMYVSIAVKLVVALVGLLIMTRLLGKKEISQLTAFDFVSSLMLSELVGNTIYDDNVHLSHHYEGSRLCVVRDEWQH